MKNKKRQIKVSSHGEAREIRELRFYRQLVEMLDETVGFRIIRPWPQNLNDLQVVLPAEADRFLELISEKISLDEFIGSVHFLKGVGLRLRREAISPLMVECVLQATMVYKKVFEVCDTSYITAAVERYHEDERELAHYDDLLAEPDDYLKELLAGARRFIASVIGLSPEHINVLDLRSGPGAVAEQRNHVARWQLLPDLDLALCGELDLADFNIDLDDPSSETSRMISVPKTATKPRLIAAEPAWRSFYQQALLDQFKRKMAAHPTVDISNQDRNGWFCYAEGFATLDQSRASDRVSACLVTELFPIDWAWALWNSRTPQVQCLCGETHHLRKFAGMGSACTFPVETLVFAGLAASAIAMSGGLPDTDVALVDYTGLLGVFGDDVVVPERYAHDVARAFGSVGLVMNDQKSYTSGRFKESCGVYTFNGVDVTPSFRRHWLPDTDSDVDSIVSAVEFVNSLQLRYLGVEALQPLTGIENMPVVPYDIDQTHPKQRLVRHCKGFGWWDWEHYTPGYPKRHLACCVHQKLRHHKGEQPQTIVDLALARLERQGCEPDVHMSVDEYYEPRPEVLRLALQRVGELPGCPDGQR